MQGYLHPGLCGLVYLASIINSIIYLRQRSVSFVHTALDNLRHRVICLLRFPTVRSTFLVTPHANRLGSFTCFRFLAGQHHSKIKASEEGSVLDKSAGALGWLGLGWFSDLSTTNIRLPHRLFQMSVLLPRYARRRRFLSYVPQLVITLALMFFAV